MEMCFKHLELHEIAWSTKGTQKHRLDSLTPWLLDLLTQVDSSGAPAKASQPPWFPPYSSELDVAATGATCAIGAVGAAWAAWAACIGIVCIGIAAAMGGGFTKVALRLWKDKKTSHQRHDFSTFIKILFDKFSDFCGFCGWLACSATNTNPKHLNSAPNPTNSLTSQGTAGSAVQADVEGSPGERLERTSQVRMSKS